MGKLIETSLIIKRETIFDKIRKNLLLFIYQKDYQIIQRLDNLVKPKRPNSNNKIIIPKEIRKGKQLRNML